MKVVSNAAKDRISRSEGNWETYQMAAGELLLDLGGLGTLACKQKTPQLA